MIVCSTINYRSKLLSSLGFKYFYNQDCIYNWKNQLLRAKDSLVIVFLKTGVCIISWYNRTPRLFLFKCCIYLTMAMVR